MTFRDNERRLEEGLAALPRRIHPNRNLWSDIAPRLERPSVPRVEVPRVALGMAAGLLLGLAVFLAAPRWHPEPLTSVHSSRDASLIRTRAALLEAYRERLPQMDALTRTRVQRDLAVVRAAEKDLGDALQNSPNSEVLLSLYAGALHQEFNLYDTVLTTTEINSSRNST